MKSVGKIKQERSDNDGKQHPFHYLRDQIGKMIVSLAFKTRPNFGFEGVMLYQHPLFLKTIDLAAGRRRTDGCF